MNLRLTAWLAFCSAASVAVLGDGCAPPPELSGAQPSDTDRDGVSDRDELIVHGTSPLLSDTDGDGWTDFEEIVEHAFDPASDPLRFNPRVADLPEIEVVFTSAPRVTLVLQTTDGESQSFETRQRIEESTSVTIGRTSTIGKSDTISTPVSETNETIVTVTNSDQAGVGGAGGAGGAPGPRDASAELRRSVTTAFEPSTTIDSSLASTELRTDEHTEIVEQAQVFVESHDIATSGGVLDVTATVVNRGHVAFRVQDIIVTATMRGDDVIAPVGNLVFDAPYNAFPPFTLAPGEESAPLNFVKTGLTLDVAGGVLDAMDAVALDIAISELLDSKGRPFVFKSDEMRSKTAAIVIDYGRRAPSERFLVATNFDPASPGVTADVALREILRIPVETSAEGGLRSIRNVGGERATWSVELIPSNGSDPIDAGTGDDLANIRLRAGDVLRLSCARR